MADKTFIMMATFKEGTDMAEVFSLVAEEGAKVEELRASQRMGFVHLALARGTVFIEVFAADEAGAISTVNELPMGKFFVLDIFETNMPPSNEEAQP